MICGIHPVMEKLRQMPSEVAEIVIAVGNPHGALESIIAESRRLGLRVRSVERPVLNRICGTDKHQGVAARIAGYAFYAFADLLREGATASAPFHVLTLDGVTDPRNLGALLRTAEGAGVRHVLIPEHRAAGLTSSVAKTSAGAIHYLKISRVPNLHRALILLKKAGLWAIGLDVGGEPIYGRTYPDKLVIVVGAEGSGIRPLIRRECDLIVGLPMQGSIESLNVAVATGVFLYEILRQEAYARGSG